MAKVYVTQAGGSGGSVATGVLQLSGGAAMTSTLTAVTDQNNTASPLKLSTTAVQVVSPLRVTTDDPSDMYLDLEDGSANNRFNITRATTSQQVNLNFASNPGGSTTVVGAIRTYVDGVNLSEIMTFREDGNIGIGTLTPGAKLDVHASTNVVAQFNRTGAGKSWIQFLQAGAGKWNVGYDNTNGNYTIYDVVNSTDRMVVTNAGNVGIGTSAPSATTHIKGSGSTSATTSLLVQNSGGSTALEVKDNLTVGMGGAFVNSNAGAYVTVASFSASYAGILLNSTSGTASKAGIGLDSAKLFFGDETNSTTLFGYRAMIDLRNGGFVVKNDTTAGATASLNASAVLQADSTTRGFLPPRMTNAQRLAIATPAVGLIVYCTDAVEGLYIYKSTGWTFII